MSWHLSWSDEFNGAALNSSWSVRTNQSHCCGPFGGPGELQLYLPDEVSAASISWSEASTSPFRRPKPKGRAVAGAAHAASSRRRSIFCASRRRSFGRRSKVNVKHLP